MQILLKVDISNEKGCISKDHGLMIPKGTELDFDPVPDRIKQLLALGIVEEIRGEPPEDPDEEDLFEEDPEDQDDQGEELPDDLDALKEKADELGIEYARNIGAAKLKERIQKHLDK